MFVFDILYFTSIYIFPNFSLMYVKFISKFCLKGWFTKLFFNQIQIEEFAWFFIYIGIPLQLQILSFPYQHEHCHSMLTLDTHQLSTFLIPVNKMFRNCHQITQYHFDLLKYHCDLLSDIFNYLTHILGFISKALFSPFKAGGTYSFTPASLPIRL